MHPCCTLLNQLLTPLKPKGTLSRQFLLAGCWRLAVHHSVVFDESQQRGGGRGGDEESGATSSGSLLEMRCLLLGHSDSKRAPSV